MGGGAWIASAHARWAVSLSVPPAGPGRQYLRLGSQSLLLHEHEHASHGKEPGTLNLSIFSFKVTQYGQQSRVGVYQCSKLHLKHAYQQVMCLNDVFHETCRLSGTRSLP